MGLLDMFRATKIKEENEALKKRINELGCDTYEQVKEKIQAMELTQEKNNKTATDELQILNATIFEDNNTIYKLRNEIDLLNNNSEKLQRQVNTQTRKLQRSKELYKSVDYCISNFLSDDYSKNRLSTDDEIEYDDFSPSVILKLHCMDMKDLRKTYQENEKQINKLLESYASRYTTKANRTIYQLMVIALRAELQNTLYNLKYEKLEQCTDNIKVITSKYLKIAGDGNQSIVGTLTKFIGEIEYLFINAIKIEYNYYVKKEQAKQEQLAIKQQMREEAEERKQLEQEKKKIEQEENKYQTEIDKATQLLAQTTDEKKLNELQARILELQGQLSNVVLKKEEITNLQNGKAGNVYIISNLGSFGENTFKIGMTRRLNPQERIDELGSASVPFRFDVHSFVFSDDAVGLEGKLHSILNDKRVNKVNLRKEFFYSTLDELETLVTELDPTAEFSKTMVAEEFRQSQSTDRLYTNDYVDLFDDDLEE